MRGTLPDGEGGFASSSSNRMEQPVVPHYQRVRKLNVAFSVAYLGY